MKIAEYLKSLETFGIKLGLAQTNELLSRAGYNTDPAKKPYFIHLAGSNGKGSTGAMIQKALTKAGKKVGFYTSPHLAVYNERMRINGTMISDEELEHEFQQLMPHAEAMKENGRFVTYFEFTTILALGYFLHNDVDFIVWETGMGGRFDSTNFIIPEASVITNIALEHCKYLGDTLEKIAFEKGGIIKDGVPVFCGMMPHAARDVLQRTAAGRSAPFHFTEKDFELLSRENMNQIIQTPCGPIRLSLAGAMQRRNFTLAYSVLEYLSKKFDLDFKMMLDAMQSVSWPGRFQLTADHTILDGGHNPDGIAALREALEEFFPGEKFTFVFASFEDKDTAQCLGTLLPIAAEFCFVPLADQHRPSCSPARLCKLIRNHNREFKDIRTYDSLAQYLSDETPDKSKRVICGSLYLLGEYFQHTDFAELKNI